MAQAMDNAIRSNKNQIYKKLTVIIMITLSVHLYASDHYYRLDNFDANYNKLKDPPLKIDPDKKLHPSSIYKPQRPPRVEKEPDYDRKEIVNNQQALNRLNGYPQTNPRVDYFLLGIGGGIALYAHDDKRQISGDLYAKIGYFRYLNLNAIRAYINLGTRLPIDNSNPTTLSFSGNVDFLLNLKIFHIYAGIGYGGEYYTMQKFLSQGININLGLSKQLGYGAIDFGVTIPFYTKKKKNIIIKNNIIFTLGYSYKI